MGHVCGALSLAVSSFIAIAWMYRDDYERAGYRVLPGKIGRRLFTALQATLPAALLIPFEYRSLDRERSRERLHGGRNPPWTWICRVGDSPRPEGNQCGCSSVTFRVDRVPANSVHISPLG
jgi:hypothetical protein